MDVLVTYDISTADRAGERRLARVAAVCERYGTRVQYSVFECRLDEIQFERLKSELIDEMDVRVDSIRMYRLSHQFGSARLQFGSQRREWDRPIVF